MSKQAPALEFEASFASSMTLVLASGFGPCLGQPQLRRQRRFERPRRGTEDERRAARARNGGRGRHFAGEGQARRVRPRHAVLARERWNDERLADGEAVANFESEIASCTKWAGDGPEWRFC
jgi:hypothetical protein